MTEPTGNPFFSKKGTKAFSEACAEMNSEACITRMNELHHSDYKFPSRSRKTRSRK